MLIDSQRILTFSGDSLDDAAAVLHAQIDELPLTAKVTSLTSACGAGAFSGMAIVELIPEVEATVPGPAVDGGDATHLRVGGELPDEI